jgi:hypothetical protein
VAIRDRDLSVLLDATHRFSAGITVLLTMHYGGMWTWSRFYNRAMQNIAFVCQLPDLMRNLHVQARLANTYDQILRVNERTYDATVTYNWRAVALNVRFVGYRIANWNRNDVYITITRPFEIDLQ